MKTLKEKISLLSKGIFEYEKPDIVVSEETVRIEAEAQTVYTGSFDVTSINGLPVRAMVFSSNKLVACQESSIVGTQCRVNYTFDPKTLEPGETIEGHFSIISNGGEIAIPFSAHVCMPFCRTSIGDIKDLYQFTRLAQSNWHEAVKLFRSTDFSRVFLVNKKHGHIYENLIRSRNTNQALEEFLCTIKRKQPVNIRVSQDEIYLENVDETLSERLLIEKDTWGYARLFVKTVGDFVKVYKKELTTEDFLGSYYELEYMIYPEAFRQGNNYGKIIISTFQKTIEIPVNCIQEVKDVQQTQRRSVRSSVYDIFNNFLKLSMDRMSREDWIRQTREAIDCCRNNSNELIYELMEAHFSILAGEEDNAHEILDGKNGREIRHYSVVYYGYYLYLTSLLRKDEDYTRFALDKIESDYGRQYDYWQLLWFIFHMTDKLSPQKRFLLVKDQFSKGCRSPLMYWEAVKAMNEEPSLMREFGRFEIQLMTWASHNDCLKMDVIYQFAEVCVHSRVFDELALNTLIELCQIYENKELLMAVCSMLIKGHKTDFKYNRWYALGIESSLRLTDIYEYYMYSLDESKAEDLPLGVLIYFNYDNQMSVSKKAFIYAYVVNHRDALPKIYRDYENIIKAFTYEQLKKGYISRNMVVLYHQFVTMERMNTKTAGFLPKVLFKYQVFCDHPGISGVIVSHREVENEAYYPLNDGLAFVDIYMDEYQLVFVDKDENRYIGSVEYTMSRLMDDSGLLKECYRMEPSQPMILLNRSERAMKYQKMDEASIDIYKRTLKLPNIRKEYQKNVLKNLIDFYYDNYEGETLEKYLLRLDIQLMDTAERGRIIEYYIQRGLYEKALEAIKIYGYENIQDKKLMRLCSRIIRSTDFSQDSLMTEMAYYTFSCGKYDDVILEYLIKYYLGTTKDLYAIWKAAKDFEVNAFVLEEKLICQILFCESYVDSGMAVFASYYKSRPDSRIVRAFLAFYCYNYLVRGAQTDEALFGYVEIELDQLEQASEVCTLALLKYYSQSGDALKGHEDWVRRQLGFFMEKGIILPFFKAFASIADLPEEILDRVYVQYCTNPKNTVTICYEYHEEGKPDGEYIIEDMPNVFCGIFVKAFTIFANEEVKYHITEKNGYGETITDGQSLKGEERDEREPHNGRQWIDQMLCLAREDADIQLEENMEKFESWRYMSKKLFDMIQ